MLEILFESDLLGLENRRENFSWILDVNMTAEEGLPLIKSGSLPS
jgi:hypothetical protein